MKMVDENNRLANSASRKKSSKMATANSQVAPSSNNNSSSNNNNNNNNSNTKRRRSIFSVLFNQSSKKPTEEDINDEWNNGDKQQAKKELPVRLKKSEILNSDIVLIHPKEAKCVEATVEIIKPKNKIESWPTPRSLEVSERNKSMTRSESKRQSIRLAMRRKLKSKSKRRNEEFNDNDSYILDLKDQLKAEKLRISSSDECESVSESSSHSNSSSRSGSKMSKSALRPKLSRNLVESDAESGKGVLKFSPIDDLWRTNNEYIPYVLVKPTPPPRPPPPQNKKSGLSAITTTTTTTTTTTKTKTPAINNKRRQRSPMLEQFLSSHQIQFDDLNPSRNSSSEEDANSHSSCDSNSASALSRLPPYHRAHFDHLISPTQATDALHNCDTATEPMSESDRRLYHWRKLAERSVSMWQVPNESSDSADELELMNCHSPALVCYCSDDTSCSSVELIWSQPRTLEEREVRRLSASKDFQQRQTEKLKPVRQMSPLSANERRLMHANSISPARSQLSEDSVSTPTSRETPSSVGSKSVSQKHQLRYLQVINNNNNNNNNYHYYNRNFHNNNNTSCSSLLSECHSINYDSWRQKPAVLELAKPSRARDRRIGDGLKRRNTSYTTKESRGQVVNDKLMSNQSIDCSADGNCDKRQEKCQAGQQGQVQRSASGTSANEWVANPLFGRDSCVKDTRHYGAKSMDVPEIKISEPRRLRRGLSVDLLTSNLRLDESRDVEHTLNDENELSKRKRFMNFLSRLKRLELGGQNGDKSDENCNDRLIEKRPSEDLAKQESEEQFDNFSVNETGAFDVGERAKRHRWSLRMRSPFYGQSAATRPDLGRSSYLSQHLVNLDRRIKSNVSSLKSQLSDTSKRASVLADQLITSIKDNTKEQLLSVATGTSPRDRYDTLPNSFATSVGDMIQQPQDKQHFVDCSTPTMSSVDSKKAKQFSLIYKHQQAQADGHLVITRQPTATSNNVGSLARLTSVRALETPLANDAALVGVKYCEPKEAGKEQAKAEQSLEEIIEACKRENETVMKKKHKSEIVSGLVTAEGAQTIGACNRGREIQLRFSSKLPCKKRLLPKKARRQINVAPPDSDGDDDHSWPNEDKLGPTGQYFKTKLTTRHKRNVTY